MSKPRIPNQKSNLEPEDIFQELLFPPTMWEKPIKHYVQTITVSIHHFYIGGEIEEELDQYMDMFNILKTSEDQDQIYIYLNTPGGSLATTIQIISAIDQSLAHVITVIEGEVCSAGTLIFLAGDEYLVNDHCTMMIHNYSDGSSGKGGELKARVEYFERYFEKLAKHFYKDFLTDKEIKDVCNDKDIWMESEEIMKRLARKSDVEIQEEGLKEKPPLSTTARSPTPAKRKKRVKKKTTGK